jgi:DNA-binding transcriptional LysR family regulator
LTIETCNTSEDVLLEGLPSGRIDAAVFLSGVERHDLRSVALLADRYAVVVKEGHPLAGRDLHFLDLARFRQVALTPVGIWADHVGRAFEGSGQHIERALSTAHIQVALDVVLRTDYFSVFPLCIANQMARKHPLEVLAFPEQLEGFSLSLYWHERSHVDPLRAWFRDQIRRLVLETYDIETA